MIHTKIDGQEIALDLKLVEKYNRPGPRYTSYPTAPNWSDEFRAEDYRKQLEKSNALRRPLSFYFHIPFCEERCTFCACSVIPTKNHKNSDPYLEILLTELNRVSEILDRSRRVEQIHLGGGTPTFLTSEQFKKLFGAITSRFTLSKRAEISIEVDPRVTTDEQLLSLRELGFNRVSLGVQDFDSEVQRLAGRIQSESETRHTVSTCRSAGFESVNLDLVYGLPKQTPEKFGQALRKILALDPDRIALFNFAYVPWMHAHQKKILESDLPTPAIKLQMFCEAIEIFQNAGYDFIGLDHFAKQKDELSQAKRNGTMYRNFQGYTTKADCDLVAMGVTSISTIHDTFAQNAKKLKDYQEGILENGLASRHGLKLSEDDLMRQWVIREIFCHQNIVKKKFKEKFGKEFDSHFSKELCGLKALEQDHLVTFEADGLRVTPLGRFFLRNIGMAFDAYLKPGQGRFSRTV